MKNNRAVQIWLRYSGVARILFWRGPGPKGGPLCQNFAHCPENIRVPPYVNFWEKFFLLKLRILKQKLAIKNAYLGKKLVKLYHLMQKSMQIFGAKIGVFYSKIDDFLEKMVIFLGGGQNIRGDP